MTDRSALDYRFDERVVGRYDALRGHPADVASEIGRFLSGLVKPKARVLELGVGTGRIALPLAAAGVEVVGIDRSHPMLAQLSARVDHSSVGTVHLIRGDIKALPFRPAAFDAALAVHVLHLVADWAAVLERVSQLVRPQGRLLLGRDWIDPESFSGQLRNQFRRTVVEVGKDMLPPGAAAATPPAGGGAMAETLNALGARAVGAADQVAAEWPTRISPSQVLHGIRTRDEAESWVLPDDMLTETMVRLDRFAASQWLDLDAPQPVKRRFLVNVFEFS